MAIRTPKNCQQTKEDTLIVPTKPNKGLIGESPLTYPAQSQRIQWNNTTSLRGLSQTSLELQEESINGSLQVETTHLQFVEQLKKLAFLQKKNIHKKIYN